MRNLDTSSGAGMHDWGHFEWSPARRKTDAEMAQPSSVAPMNANGAPSQTLKTWPSEASQPPKALGDSLSDTARDPGSARPSLAPAGSSIGLIKNPGALSASADKASSMTHKVEGTGHIKVDVNGPAGTKASAKGSGLFNKTTLNRNMANQRSSEHSQPQAAK